MSFSKRGSPVDVVLHRCNVIRMAPAAAAAVVVVGNGVVAPAKTRGSKKK